MRIKTRSWKRLPRRGWYVFCLFFLIFTKTLNKKIIQENQKENMMIKHEMRRLKEKDKLDNYDRKRRMEVIVSFFLRFKYVEKIIYFIFLHIFRILSCRSFLRKKKKSRKCKILCCQREKFSKRPECNITQIRLNATDNLFHYFKKTYIVI